jgi:glutamate racemase
MLTGVLQIVMGPSVTLVSSAEETAKDVVRVLTERDLLADPDSAEAEPDGEVRHELVATGPGTPFVRLAKRFLGPELGAVVAATP